MNLQDEQAFQQLSQENANLTINLVNIDNNQIVSTEPYNYQYFQQYNHINLNIPHGYTDNGSNLGIQKIEATENSYTIWYGISAKQDQSSIIIQYINQENIIQQNTVNSTIGDIFNGQTYTQNIPSGYKYLLISTGANIQRFQPYTQYFDIDIAKIPTTSSVEIVYQDERNGNILNSSITSGTVGSSFPLSTYESEVPTDFYFDNTNNPITTFGTDSDIVVLNCQIETGTITIDYSNNDNTISSTSVTGDVGSSFDISQYTNNIPSGYTYVSDNASQVPTFQLGNQTVTINIKPSIVYVQVNYIVMGGSTVGTYTYSNEPGHTGWAGWNVPSGYSLAPGSNFANFNYGDSDVFNYNVYVVKDSSAAPSSSASQSNSSAASISASISTENSIHGNTTPMSFTPVPSSSSAPTGSTNAQFVFQYHGYTIIDPTIHISYGYHSMHHVLVLVKNKGYYINAGASELTAGDKTYKITDTYVTVTPGGQQVYYVSMKRA